MTATLRTLGALLALLLICLALWAVGVAVARVVWTFLLFLIGAIS